MKPEFREDYIDDNQSTLDGRVEEFAYEEVERRLGCAEPKDEPEEAGLPSHELAPVLKDGLTEIIGEDTTFEPIGARLMRVRDEVAGLSTPEARMFRTIADFCTSHFSEQKNQYNRSRAYVAGEVFVAFCWALSPGYLRGRSLTNVAKDFGVTTPVLSNKVVAVSQFFGITNRAQDSLAKARVRAARKLKPTFVSLDAMQEGGLEDAAA